MGKLPITKKEYDAAVLITEFLRQIKEISQKDKTVTDIHFKPEVTGYDITFNHKGVKNRVSIEKSRHLLSSALTVTHLKGEKDKNILIIKDSADIITAINCIFE